MEPYHLSARVGRPAGRTFGAAALIGLLLAGPVCTSALADDPVTAVVLQCKHYAPLGGVVGAFA